MSSREDIDTRRRRYAMYRLGLAMKRLLNADSEAERVMTTRWVNAWGRAIGERWFARRPYGSDASAVVTRPASRTHGGLMGATGVAEPGQLLQ
jgi:hypothetical protein